MFKVASRCNLNCSYCYVYNKGDETWRDRPRFMSDDVVAAGIDRIRRWCEQAEQRRVQVTFHGGEPLLAGRARFDRWCTAIRNGLAGTADVRFNIQTNATLIDDDWAELFLAHGIEVGVSIDGPAAVHDAQRVDIHGAGSHARVVRGVETLHAHGVWAGALAVIQLGADGVAVHRHLRSLGFRHVNYLLPDFTHDTIGPVRAQFGATPVADYLLPLFDEWWFDDPLRIRIPLFVAVTRLLLGGASNIDMVGNEPFGFVFIEADGAIEDLDSLRVCRNGMAGTGLNVFTDEASDIATLSSVHRAAMFDGLAVPTACAPCPEHATCRGGYLTHRYSAATGFDNPSVWCADLLALFTHARERLDVDVEETAVRRQALEQMVPR
ncbi:FxsB family radical SAM/SPASM domain protein [Kribbella alba]|uniref:FxsB family radical SAM/SPASM domain protein n=1 Tax=Kribbella alba TaxID=190197 RepID=A0ABN2FYQ1_9ACTN